jgi:hypothetical protein
MNPFPLWSATPNNHIGLAMRSGNAVCVALRIFSTVCGVINVADDATRYPEIVPTNQDGRFIELDPKSGAIRESTLRGSAPADAFTY